MMKFLACLGWLVASKQMTNFDDYIVVLRDKPQQVIKETIMIGQVKDIKTFNQSGVYLSSEIVFDKAPQQHTSICDVMPHDIEILQDNANIQQIFHDNSQSVTGMTHVEDGMVVITSSLELLGYYITKSDSHSQHYKNYQVFATSFKKNFLSSRTQMGQHFVPRIVYNPKSSFVYLIAQSELVYFKIDITEKFVGEKQRVQLNITEPIVTATSSQLYLYLATRNIIYIYEIALDGSLTHFKDVVEDQVYPMEQKNLDIVDLGVGGRNGQYLYVLDKNNGVFTILVERNRASLNVQLGIIEIKGGYRMDQYLDESLLVLVEMPAAAVKSYKVVDFSIDLYKGLWLKLNEYQFPGRATDIDVSKSFAVVRGVDSQRIIFHSRYQGFVKEKQKDITFYSPRLIALDLFEPNFGKQHEAEWHFNQSHSMIFGVSQNQLRIYPWTEVQPFIRCYTDNTVHQNEEFHYTFHTNMTECAEKELMGDVMSRDLFVCERIQQIQLKVEGVFIGSRRIQFIVFAACMVLLIVGLVVLFLCKYLAYRHQFKNRDIEITTLVKRSRDLKYAQDQKLNTQRFTISEEDQD